MAWRGAAKRGARLFIGYNASTVLPGPTKRTKIFEKARPAERRNDRPRENERARETKSETKSALVKPIDIYVYAIRE